MNSKVLARLIAQATVWLALLAIASTGVLCGQEPLKVSEDDARHAAVKRSEPAYPPMAKQMHITGKATVEVVIDAEGKVEACRPVVGNPLLTNGVIPVVKKWIFKPFTAGGKPTKAIANLTFTFEL